MMAKDDVNDYEKLKSALLKRYQLTVDGFRKRFRTSRPEAGESPSQFITRIGNYLQRWIDLAKAAETYDGVKKLFIEEQYLRNCPKEMATHLKEGKPETLHDLAERAETYLEAHSMISFSGLIRSFPRSGDPFSPKDATTVDLQITPGTSAPSLSRQRLLRTQEHHSLRSDHLVRSRNHQATLPSSPLHLDVNHLGASSATRLDTLLETTDRSSPLPWNTRVITGLPHSRIISSSRTTRSSQSLMTYM